MEENRDEYPSEKEINFPKRRNPMRPAIAILFVLASLCLLWWMYDQEFHYPNTEAGRLAAARDFLTDADDTSVKASIRPDTPLRVVAYAEKGDYLYLSYAADNEDQVHGIFCLTRGVNNQYRPVQATRNPFPYTAGVYGETVWTKIGDPKLFALTGDNCQGIALVRIKFLASPASNRALNYTKIYEIKEPDFLWLFDQSSLKQEFGIPHGSQCGIYIESFELLDKDGQNITDQYRNNVKATWAGSKTSEFTDSPTFLYTCMRAILVVDILFVYFCLRRPRKTKS
jgi:hypothetical protein